LIDLARKIFGPEGSGANRDPARRVEGSQSNPAPAFDKSDSSESPERLAFWTEFHGRVESLSEEEREVVDLLWYQELTHAEAAAIVGVAERTVRRRWLAARKRLGAWLSGEAP